MPADEHDRKVAAISHLPHAAATVLLENAGRIQERSTVASSGLADTTRVASGDPELWADIFLHNAGAVADQLGEYGRNLQRVRDLVARGDRPGLVALLRASKESRDGWLAGVRRRPESGKLNFARCQRRLP